MSYLEAETEKQIFSFIGSYAEPEASGVYVCSYQPSTGKLTLLDGVADLKNPTFLDIHGAKQKLYAITEKTDSAGNRCGAAVSFTFDPETGKLSKLNEEVTVAGPTCHITLDRTGTCLMVASYHGGMIGLSPLTQDGQITKTSDVQQHQGSSIHPVQSQARAHSVNVDPKNRFAIVCDLGTDTLHTYKLDLDHYKFIPQGKVKVAAGAGPRHFVFHPSQSFGYVINELNSSVTAFSYDQEEGKLTEIQTLSTLPDDYKGENACADIHISPDGLFLYGSNRGHDSIVVYGIEPSTGHLHLIEHVSTGGQHPRNFALSPDGHFLLVANRDTNDIITFARDAETGKLHRTEHTLQLSKPVCIKFATL